jgi:hypothetical protein
MLDDYPKVKLVGQSLIIIVVSILVFILIYNDRIKKYVNDNWVDIRCNPLFMPLAGFAETVDGATYGDKVTTNFNKCMNTNLEGFMGKLLGPFMVIIGGIVKITKQIGKVLNSFRESLAVLRVMFQAFIGNTMDKLNNSYSVMIYLREKMKHIIKRQVAVMEIMKQLLKALPFLIYSLSRGPLPRFAVWFGKYLGVLIAVLVICLLCVFGSFFVSIFACPICLLCFTEDSIVGTGKYAKKIDDIKIGDNLDDNTVVTGRIVIKGDENHPFPVYKLTNDCILTGSHLVYKNGWKRVKDLGIPVEYINSNLVCLITNTHIIPTKKYLCMDYIETSNPSVLCRQMDTVKQYLNYKSMNTRVKIEKDRPICYAGFSCKTINELTKNEDNEIYGWIEIEDDNVEWYSYEGMILTGNQLIFENGEWIRVYESINGKRVIYNSNRVYNVISINGSIVCNGNLMRDFMETHNEDVQEELLRQLDKYHQEKSI